MNQRKANLLIGVFALLAMLAGLALFNGVRVTVRHASQADAPVTDLFTHTFPDADGRMQPINRWKGSLLVVNFWATWCAPCVEEMPMLEKVSAQYANRGVTVVGLAIDNAAAVRRFRDDLKLNLPLLVAGPGGSELIRQLGNASGALPYTVLFDRDGRVVQTKLGQIREVELRLWLDGLLKT